MTADALIEDAAAASGVDIRLAQSRAEVEAAQRLRYRVFYDEMGARPTEEMAEQGRDFDAYDDVCDHLLVVDQRREGLDQVVGTYRLMRRPHVEKVGRFYSAAEYDIRKIEALQGNVLELGRSCVAPDYRTKMTMQLLWRGIAAYVFQHNIDLMFGCASLPGTDPQALALPLAYLHHHHLAPDTICPRALPEHYVSMDLMGKDAINPRQALNQLPPLVKGYLRLGGFVGDGAVVDHQFNTTDVCVIVKTDLITEKYVKHYDRTATRAL